jgi:hypothetical protein
VIPDEASREDTAHRRGSLRRRPIPDDLLRAMANADHLALAEFEAGTAGKRALIDLRDSLSIAAELARAGIGLEALPLLLRAVVVLRQAAARGLPMRVQGDHLQVLQQGVEAAQAQRRLCTLAEFQRASARDDEQRREVDSHL